MSNKEGSSGNARERRVLLFGNSGAGKSTLAKQLCAQHGLAHLDLDTLAWETDADAPVRRPLAESAAAISAFVDAQANWVIEGCYADLLALLSKEATEAIWLNLPIETCISNARERPWEPHKYASKAAQDANLSMLVDWIRQYGERDDTFSLRAHQALFDQFAGRRHELTSNAQTTRFTHYFLDRAD